MRTPDVQLHVFSREDFHFLSESGRFPDEERVELVDGQLVVMSPPGKRHAKAIRRGINLLTSRLAGRCLVDAQNPLNLSTTSEPQPDLLLLRPEFAQSDELPEARDVLLVIEAAHSSLEYDRTVKLRVYAEAGIPEVWIYNLQDEVIEAYREPSGGAYQMLQCFRPGERLAPLAFPDVHFGVEELLP